MPAHPRAEQLGDRLVADAAAAVGRDIAACAGGPPDAAARSRRRPAPRRGRRSRIHAWRCASRTTTRRGRRIGARDARETTVARASASASPAAMFARGRSSTTSGGAARARRRPRRAARAAPRRARRRGRPARAARPRRDPRGDARARARRASCEPLGRDARRDRARGRAATASSSRSWPTQQRVDAGGERQHGAVARRRRLAQRLHLERVGDHEPVVAELVAQQPRAIARAQGRGRVVERGHEDVRRHDRLHARLDRGAERRQPVARRRRRRPAARGASPARSRRGRGSASRTRRRPAPAGPSTNARDVPRDERRVGAERADADHRVARVRR